MDEVNEATGFLVSSKIKNRDITSMFNGLLTLVKEQARQEQNEKYLQLKLKYTKLKYLYTKLKEQLRIKQNNL